MFKSKLQELCHQHSWPLPAYTTAREGPDHTPRFTATVTVNGVEFQTTPFEFRSSKEAQNQAAKIAFDHFSDPRIIFQGVNVVILPETSAGFSTSDANKSSVSGILPPTKLEGQSFRANQVSLNHEDVTRTKGNLYKNRLQNYAQKRNLTLPMYSCEVDGPPHARRFKSRVTIDGSTYEAPDFFSTLKDAEHAAAKVAFEALPPDDVQEDGGLYKSLLQELATKMGYRFPVYETVKTGPPHMPVFLSTVEIGDGSFRGEEAKTKKQAEMSAAKVAYTRLTEGKVEGDGTAASTNCAPVVSSSNLESTVINESLPNAMPIPNEMQLDIKSNADLSNGREQIAKGLYDLVSGLATEKDAAFSSGSKIVRASLASPSSLQTKVIIEMREQAVPNVSDKMESHAKSINNLQVQEEHAEKGKVTDVAKRNRSASPDGHMQSPSESSPKSAAMVSEKTTKPARQKILVRSYKPNVTYTDGPIVDGDDKWVAMRVSMDQDQ